jgi:DNA-binding transcriptional MerR regulator
MVLKELGLSLDQIAQMLDSEPPTEQLRGMLALKEAELQQQVDEEQARLARIRFHIRQIDMEADMSQLDVRIKKVEPFRALTIRILAKTHDDIARVGREAQETLQGNNVHPISTPLTIVYADEFRQHDVDIEFVWPVDGSRTENLPLPASGTMTLREVPGIEAATCVYEGRPSLHINDNLVDMQRWVAANGYKLSNMLRMVHLRGALEILPFDEWLTEIQYPLEKA